MAAIWRRTARLSHLIGNFSCWLVPAARSGSLPSPLSDPIAEPFWGIEFRGDTARLWDAETGAEIAVLKGHGYQDQVLHCHIRRPSHPGLVTECSLTDLAARRDRPLGLPRDSRALAYPSNSPMAASRKRSNAGSFPGLATQWPQGESKGRSSACGICRTSIALSSGGK